MAQLNAELAALIGSRICHDLISPIGAINNGLELLSMSRDATGPEIGLIGESASNASARIRFFRIAFGAAGDQMVGPAEVISILKDHFTHGRIEFVWSPEAPQPRAAVRLAFLSILCMETAMPYGGQMQIAEEAGDWTIKGRTDRPNVTPDLWARRAGKKSQDALLPAQVQFGLLPLVALDERRKLQAETAENEITIRF